MTDQHPPLAPDAAAPVAASVPVRSTSSALGRVSLVLAALVVVASATSSTVVQSFFLSSEGIESIQVVYGTYAVVGSVISLVALVLGIIALADRSRPRLAAAAGTALAVSYLFSTIVSYISSALLSVLN